MYLGFYKEAQEIIKLLILKENLSLLVRKPELWFHHIKKHLMWRITFKNRSYNHLHLAISKVIFRVQYSMFMKTRLQTLNPT